MNSLSYRQFIDEINNGTIVNAIFRIEDYPHYKCCSIERIVETVPNGYSIVTIAVKLTKDSERFNFYKKYDEKRKLFNMGRKGTFTLKQMWDRIEFISIEYAP